ncbi:hypothetical protein HHK36_017267 [Tetracentron sinense]|uniref:Glycosyltransferase n=1 Tax=Tetracentron sinense TaxID=13715 RepID=A0A834Z2W1_TETSI|nr:hypothetical protein HHK36_017267 [Tetracentron sinense]
MDQKAPVVVVVVPFPAQGHLNQLLHFCCLISSYGIPVHYVGSATHNRQAKQRVHGWDPLTISNIHFHDLPIPPFLAPPPNPHIKFPTHLQPAFDASTHLRDPLAALLRSLSPTSRRIAVVHDPLMAFTAQDAVSVTNAETYTLHGVSAFVVFSHIWKSLGNPTFPGIANPNDLPPLAGSTSDQFLDFIARQYEYMMFDSGDLYNTCKSMEGAFLDLLTQEQFTGKKRQWAIGPLNPLVPDTSCDSRRQHKCLEWLDKQPPGSVLYVAFGTTVSIPDDQIMEIAIGLESSNQRFIWVLREADKGDIYAEEEEARKAKLPNGYEERVEGVGLIEREWAPQLEILAHPSTGGFLSHCGWNSCMESISMGVPIAAWPMHSDQPRNSFLVTEVLKVGVVVGEWAQHDEVVCSVTIEGAISKLMVSEEGEGMRKRAKELGRAVRESVSGGGSSRVDLESFIAHIRAFKTHFSDLSKDEECYLKAIGKERGGDYTTWKLRKVLDQDRGIDSVPKVAPSCGQGRQAPSIDQG